MFNKFNLRNLKPQTIGKIIALVIFLKIVDSFMRNGIGFVGSVLFPIWSPPVEMSFPSEVVIKKNSCHILLPVEVNGQVGMFLFDPARSHSTIDTEFAGNIGRSFWLPGGIGISFIKTLEIGTMKFKDLRLPVNRVVQEDLLEKIDGILGVDFLINIRATIKLAENKLVFDAPRSRIPYKWDGSAKMYYSFEKLTPVTELFYAGLEFQSKINFLNKKDILLVETDSREVWKTKPQYFLLGKKKIPSRPTVEFEGVMSFFKDIKVELGCPLLLRFSHLTIDLKMERMFFKMANAEAQDKP